jgi:hypothetical protein
MQDHIHPSVHHHAAEAVIGVYRILQAPVFFVDDCFWNTSLNEQIKDRFASHLRKPFVVLLSSDWIGMTD